MKTLFLTSILVLSLFFIGCGGGEEGATQSSSADEVLTNKNLLLLYVAGSNLEENGQAASIDFDELVLGYNKLSTSEKNNLDIVVAFGGARVANWKGIKYADIDCLIQDSQDNAYGNDTCYSYENSSVNMGKESTLSDFLNFTSSDIDTSDRSFLVFWNHGGAYQGVCYDSNYDFDKLEVEELNSAFRNTNTKVDVIGMDACLMANIEVVKGVQDYCNYYLASEELEPAHGWDYEEVVPIIGKGTNQTLTTVGTKLVDSFMDSQKHISTEGKTLSFLDLSQSKNVINKIESLTQSLDAENDFKSIALSAYESQKFGVNDSYKDGRVIGIKSFSQNIAQKKSSLKVLSQELESAVDSLVIYARGQDVNAHGVTIYQPLNSDDWSKYNNISYTASPAWKNLLSSFTVTKGADIQDPDIHSEEICTNGGENGFCLNITDNVALKRVESYGLLPLGDNTLVLYTEILPNDGDTYFLPKFSDEWLYLCDGSSNTQCIFPSAFEIEIEESGAKLYVSIGQYNGEGVSFLIKTQANEVEMWAILDTDESYGSKQQYKVKQGDTVRFDYIVVTSQGEVTIKNGDSLKFASTPRWIKEDFNANIEYFASADDFNGNDAYSDSHFTEDADGSTPTNGIDTTSSQSRLSYLEGKTVTLKYDYFGTIYNESITFNEAPQYNASQDRYIIKGFRQDIGNISCYSDEADADHVIVNSVIYMFDCPQFFESDAKDLFAFNINTDNTLSGYYEYVNATDTALNLYDEIKNPDSVLVESSIN